MASFPLRALAPILLPACTALQAQLTVNTSFTPQQLVNDILVGQGVSVSNITFNGVALTSPHDQLSAFNGASSNIGLPQGVVLCTGRTTMVQGQNNNPSLTVPAANPVNTPDPDLGMLMPQLRSLAVLEFDFVPTTDSIGFRFVFGSEEYNEYVCSMYNDVFGFFLSGPGIAGSFSNGAVNLGTVPNTIIPITINSVNNGTPGVLGSGAATCSAFAPGWQAHSIYYTDNAGGTSVQLDGFTVPITAGARVRCGETYHIKIALAHAGDGSLDSAVFIEGGSFAVQEDLSITATLPQGDGTLTEGCGLGTLHIQRLSDQGDAEVTLTILDGGANATDITALPPAVTIPDGSTSTSLSIGAITDGLAEGAEPLQVMVTWVLECGGELRDTISIEVLDHAPIEVSAQDVQLDCATDSVMLTATATGGLGTLTFLWPDGTDGAAYHVDGLSNSTYTVRVTDECPASVEHTIHVSSGCELLVPNVITPNGDGSNDTWVITGLGRRSAAVRVFNRWGQVVYEAARYGNNWRANGLADGTYFYEVVDPLADAPFTGTLTILGTGR